MTRHNCLILCAFACGLGGCTVLTGFGDYEFHAEATVSDAAVSDAAPDAVVDSGTDAGRDAGTDATFGDAQVDGGRDAGTDASLTDGGSDAGHDASRDAGIDAGRDTGPTDAGPVSCADDPSQERCLIHVRFVHAPRISYVWFERDYRPDGGTGMVEAWHVGCASTTTIDATTSECVYGWTPVPGTIVTFVPGFDADHAACDAMGCSASPYSVRIYDAELLMGDVTEIVESTPPIGSGSIHAFRFTVRAP